RALLPIAVGDTVLPDVGVEGERVPAERREEDAAGDEREHDGHDRADEDVGGPRSPLEAGVLEAGLAERGLDRQLRIGHQAAPSLAAPTIRRPMRSATPGRLSRIPTRRPRESTAIRSQISISSSRSVEMTSAAPPPSASSRIVLRTDLVVFRSSP